MSQRRIVSQPATRAESNTSRSQDNTEEKPSRDGWGERIQVIDMTERRPTRAEWLAHVMQLPVKQRASLRKGMRSGIWPGVIPDRMTVRLRYGEAQARSPGFNFEFYNWVANGLYDPNSTGTGNQPTGFDQWMNFYQKFVVVRARFVFSSVGNVAMNGFLWPDMTGGGSLTTPAVLGKPLVKLGMYGGSGAPALELKSEWLDIAEFLGLTPQELRANEDAWGSASANPTTKVYWATLLEASDQSTSITPRWVVQMEFDAELFDRKPLDVS